MEITVFFQFVFINAYCGPVADKMDNFSMKNVLPFLNLNFEQCINEKSLCIIQSGFLCGKKGEGAHKTKQIILTLLYPTIFLKKKYASSTVYCKNKCRDYVPLCFKISYEMNTRFTKSLIHCKVYQTGIHLMPSETVSCQCGEF